MQHLEAINFLSGYCNHYKICNLCVCINLKWSMNEKVKVESIKQDGLDNVRKENFTCVQDTLCLEELLWPLCIEIPKNNLVNSHNFCSSRKIVPDTICLIPVNFFVQKRKASKLINVHTNACSSTQSDLCLCDFTQLIN